MKSNGLAHPRTRHEAEGASVPASVGASVVVPALGVSVTANVGASVGDGVVVSSTSSAVDATSVVLSSVLEDSGQGPSKNSTPDSGSIVHSAKHGFTNSLPSVVQTVCMNAGLQASMPSGHVCAEDPGTRNRHPRRTNVTVTADEAPGFSVRFVIVASSRINSSTQGAIMSVDLKCTLLRNGCCLVKKHERTC